MKLARRLIEHLIYGIPARPAPSGREPFDGRRRRYTQDSPVLPDVWIRFGEAPNNLLDLLITPRFEVTAGDVSTAVAEAIERDREKAPVGGAEEGDAEADKDAVDIAYNQTYVAARLSFGEMVRVVLPMTRWWHDTVHVGLEGFAPKRTKKLASCLGSKKARGEVLEALIDFERSVVDDVPNSRLSSDLLWMLRIIGTIGYAQHDASEQQRTEPLDPEQVLDGALQVLGDLTRRCTDNERFVWQINVNREAGVALDRSIIAVKADAARRLFEVDCHQLAWGIIDSGVDARHVAFWDWELKGFHGPQKTRTALGKSLAGLRQGPVDDEASRQHWPQVTRVRATFDFTRVRELLNRRYHREDREDKWPSFVQTAIQRASEDGRQALREQFRELMNRLAKGRDVDWLLAEPFLRIPHTASEYEPPESEHGTHVAGILAADWPQEGLQGVCPDIELYDMRVLRPGGPNDEFAVLAALQFLSHLNNQKDLFRVHGVNLSLAIRHDVANFACGRTPVCDECERAVNSGVVVVAAAGNEGYLQYMLADHRTAEGYHTVSITDPGNAEKVVTVGSTHRFQPHTYGVSFFSSRGPTGDGRIKPDLVAPGEKVDAPVPNGGKRRKDGTSMAAPHVSGAAAMLLARHSELIGRPDRVKRVLCDTATDLGRERYFQGAGMLDVLRALQSI